MSGCSFSYLYYYSSKSSYGTVKYFYKISNNISYSYTIVNYDGSSVTGSLYVTSDYNDLSIKMIQVFINYRTSLPTSSSERNYFYLENSDYYKYSSYIYICLEDNNFVLSNNSIKYCNTYDNQNSLGSAVDNCNFYYIYYYGIESNSSINKYYYKIPITGSNSYTIVNYKGSSSSGSLYVTSDYKSLLRTYDNNDNNNNYKAVLSNGGIIGIIIGAIIFSIIIIIIICYRHRCCRKKKIGFINAIQPNYDFPNTIEYPSSI